MSENYPNHSDTILDVIRTLTLEKHRIVTEMEQVRDRFINDITGVDKYTLNRLRELVADYYSAESKLLALKNQYCIELKSELTLCKTELDAYVENLKAEIEVPDTPSGGSVSLPAPTPSSSSSFFTETGWYHFTIDIGGTKYPLGATYYDGSYTVIGCDVGYKLAIFTGGMFILYKDGSTCYDSHTLLISKWG